MQFPFSEWPVIVTGAVFKTLAVLIALAVIVYAARGRHTVRDVIARGGIVPLVLALGCSIVSLGFGVFARLT